MAGFISLQLASEIERGYKIRNQALAFFQQWPELVPIPGGHQPQTHWRPFIAKGTCLPCGSEKVERVVFLVACIEKRQYQIIPKELFFANKLGFDIPRLPGVPRDPNTHSYETARDTPAIRILRREIREAEESSSDLPIGTGQPD